MRLTDARYRLIRAPRDELYDLERDPKESASIAAERPQVRQAMRAALETLIANASIAAPAAVTDEDRQRLAALGYVGGGSNAVAVAARRLAAGPEGQGQACSRSTGTPRSSPARCSFAEAVAVYREVLADDPEMTDVWLQLAEVYTRQRHAGRGGRRPSRRSSSATRRTPAA